VRSDLSDASLTEEIKLKTLVECARVLPALEEAKLLEHRGDLLAFRTRPPRLKPTLGRLPEWRNGYVSTHYNGLGINMSPAAGELMAELIATGSAPPRAKRVLESLQP
jgi:glycine/D-amino acid oxidase-like deaminating enzyme